MRRNLWTSEFGIISAIVILGFALRFWGISFGLPYLYHPNEPGLVKKALVMGEKGFNPHWFNYPTFFMYLLFFLYGCYFVIGFFTGIFSSVQDFAYSYFIDPTAFYLIGRGTTALFGTATIILTYILGKQVFSKRVGMIGSLILAVSIMHVRHSHYITTDVPSTFFVILSFIFIYRIYYSGRVKDYILAGLFVGLGTATKYNVGLLLLPIWVAHFLRETEKTDPLHVRTAIFHPRLLISLITIGLSFFIASPFVLIDYKTFLRDFTFEATHMKTGHFGFESVSNGWIYHLTTSLREGMGLWLLVLAIFGIVLILLRKRKNEVLLLVFPLLHYLIIGSWKTVFSRYTVPMIPFLCICSAFSLDFLTSMQIFRPRVKTPILSVALVVLLVGPLFGLARIDYILTKKDTRTLAKEWIEANIAQGSLLAFESDRLWQFPQVKKSTDQLKKEIQDQENQRRKMELQYLLNLPIRPSVTYNMFYLGNSSSDVDFDVSRCKSVGVEYFISSSRFSSRYLANSSIYHKQAKFYKDLDEEAYLIKTFSPYPTSEATDETESSFFDHLPWMREDGRIRPGPVIKIYKLTDRAS
ncbi:MAG: ArnT family glycosyltransferase [Candidatus Glassbacteria bacterium]